MEIQWTLVLYSLLMGLSIGPFLLLALTDACENREALCKWAALVGLGCIVLAGLSAFAHLQKPLNAIYMFSNFRSPMTQETAAVLITGLIAACWPPCCSSAGCPAYSAVCWPWPGDGPDLGVHDRQHLHPAGVGLPGTPGCCPSPCWSHPWPTACCWPDAGSPSRRGE
jgi:hypothetical protein